MNFKHNKMSAAQKNGLEVLVKDWNLEVPDGSKINLTFLDFDVEPHYDCQWDYIELSYGASYKRYCGNLTSSLPGPIITCDNIKVKFSSDEIENFPGFRAMWSLVEDVGNIFYFSTISIVFQIL